MTRALAPLRLGLLALGVAGLAAGGLVLTNRGGAAESDQGFLAGLVSRALSSSATTVHIGAVDGALSSDATIRDIVISDRDGPWLTLDRACLIWRRTALLSRRLEVDSLEIGHLAVIRRPIPSDQPQPVKDADQPLLPDLPVKVVIKHFALDNLDLGAPILGVAARASATGNTELGSPSEGLVFNLDGKRLDSPGSFFAGLSYVPKGDALKLKVALDEPAGGLLSKIGHLPDEPPVNFVLAGDGTLDDFKADLDFHAGPRIDAKGGVTLKRHADGRDLAVMVAGHLGDLLPSLAASVFDGETDLTTNARLADDGAVALNGFALTSRLARLDAHGTFGADKTMDFAASIRAVPNAGDVAKVGDASIRTLVFDGAIQGPVKAPRIAAKLALADAHLPSGDLGRLDASVTAAPSGDITDATTRVGLEAAVKATGIAPRDKALAHAIGDSAALSLHGAVDTHGDATFQRIEARTPTVTLAYAGDLGRKRVHGTVTGAAPDLARFGDLAGARLAGRADLTIDLDGTPAQGAMDAGIAAELRDLATGLPALDRATGRRLTAKGHVSTSGDGAYAIRDGVVTGAHVTATLGGTASPKLADMAARIDLPDLAVIDPKLTGVARLDARLAGGLDQPDLTVTATLDRASAMGRPIPHLALAATLVDPRGAARTHLTLEGTVDRKPARGEILASRRQGPDHRPLGFDLDTLDIAIGSVTLKGSGAIDERGLATGAARFTAGDLDDLSPLALTKLGGTLALDATLAAPNGGQDAKIAGRGAEIAAAGATIGRLEVRVDARDILRKPVLDADAAIDRVAVAGQAISAVKFSAKGDAAKSALKLSANASGFALDAAGALVPGATTRLALASFSARRGGRTIALLGPADLAMEDGGVALRHLALGISGGRLSVEGHAGKTLDLAVSAKSVPLAAADIAVPGLGLAGTLDADARVGGTPAAPTGPYHIGLKGLAMPQIKAAGVPPIDVTASGRLDGQRVSLDAKVAAGRAGTATATGSLPLGGAGALDLSVKAKLDASVANAKLGISGRAVTGTVLVDARVAGTIAAPNLSGAATLSGGTFNDSLLGARLDAIDARVVARGDHVAVERLSATTPNGGTLSATGQVRVDAKAGFPGTLSLRGHQAQLASSSLVTAVADLSIDVSGALARDPHVGGRVDVTRVDVGIPDRLPSAQRPIDGITHVNATPAAAARLALADRQAHAAAGTKGRAALFKADLDLLVSAPNRIFVRGRGVEAELGGSLHVGGTTDKPVPRGAFDLRSGKIVALGKTLTFTKGKLAFSGDLVPELDFAAEIQTSDITARIAITGPASAPVFAFTSTPDLPSDEILSRVLFQKSSGNLSGFQALQLAQAAAQFSDGGDGAFERLRKSLGVDSLDIGADKNGPSLGVSRAIGDRLSVGVRTGATADQTGVSADVDVTRHIRLQSDVRSNGSTSVGVGSEIEY